MCPIEKDSKVSIIIPCYNHGQFLKECIDSILKQSFQDFEIIFVDDCSTDNSLEIISSYNDSRIRIFKATKNKGPAAARNLGIQNCNGVYILPVDSDNILNENCLDVFLSEIEKTPDKIIYCDIQNFGDKNNLGVVSEYSTTRLFQGNFIENCSIYKKSWWEDVGGYDENRLLEGLEDWEFWISLNRKGHYGRRIPGSLYRYRCHAGSLSRVTRNVYAITRYIRRKHDIR